MVLDVLGLKGEQITIFDMVDNRDRVRESLARGVTYVVGQITESNLDEVLSELLRPGDICLDLAWNIDTMTMLDWCRQHGVRYLNTSVEVWDPYDDAAEVHPLDRTLYVRHMAMRRMLARWGDNHGSSAVVEHGANPGLVSHWTKQALRDLGERALHDGLVIGERARTVERTLAEDAFAQLAQALDVKVIHVSERDTQISDRPKQVDEFVNTWSVDGLYEEGVAPAELGWGTHERFMPPNAFRHAGPGPNHQLALAEMGCNVRVRSRVATGEIIGMVIRHGEAFSIPEFLSVYDGDRAVYRPTVHYAYCPSDAAVASMLELDMRNYVLQPAKRIMNDEIVSGFDELGVLLMGHPYRSWWTGSRLSIDEARSLAPHQNATTLQVAASVLGAVVWMIRYPTSGVRVPDELPWDEVLAVAAPYLGICSSEPVDWDPLQNRFDIFSRFAPRQRDLDDPWQFINFLV
jgi:homospermidine synthase